jgi:hypothetical protein
LETPRIAQIGLSGNASHLYLGGLGLNLAWTRTIVTGIISFTASLHILKNSSLTVIQSFDSFSEDYYSIVK